MVAILLGFKDINQDLIGPLRKHVAHSFFSYYFYKHFIPVQLSMPSAIKSTPIL